MVGWWTDPTNEDGRECPSLNSRVEVWLGPGIKKGAVVWEIVVGVKIHSSVRAVDSLLTRRLQRLIMTRRH